MIKFKNLQVGNLVTYCNPPKHAENITTEESSLGNGWSLSHSKEKTSSSDIAGFQLKHDNAASQDAIKIKVNRTYKWLRLEYELPRHLLKIGDYRLAYEYKKISLDSAATTEVKIIEYVNGVGETLARASQNLSRSGSFRKLKSDIVLHSAGLKEARYTICFEFKAPLEFWLSNLSFTGSISNDDKFNKYDGASNYYPPYRVSHHKVSENLAQLNDQMDTIMRESPFKWAQEMLKVSLSLEDYETAVGLSDYLTHNYAKANVDPSPEAINLLVAVKIAIGEHHDIFDYLMRFRYAKKSDIAIQATRKFKENDGSHDNYYLPSGRSDIYNLSREMRNLKRSSISFETLLVHAPETAERNLFWANYYADKSEHDYLSKVNTYLKDVGSPYEVILKDHKDNILERLSFKTRKGLATISDGPLVSVIVASYNAASTINYALESLLSQTYSNIEILVCDDQSNDSTYAILDRFRSDSRIRIFKSNSNQGPYNIRNQLISQAKGEIITFHDADDIAFPHRIALQLQLMMQSKSRISLGLWLRINKNGNFIAFKDGSYLRQCLNSIMFTNTVFYDYGPFREALCAADSEFYEKIKGQVSPNDISYVTEPVVLGLWQPSSFTQSKGLESDEFGLRSASRRAYSSIAARQRLLGESVIPDSSVINTLKSNEIYRQPHKLND